MIDPDDVYAPQGEASQRERLRELASTCLAELSVLLMLFPALEMLMHEGHSSRLQFVVAALSPVVSIALFLIAAWLRGGRSLWRVLRWKKEGR